MSIKSELTVLKTNIQNAKNKLYSNLTDKGVTTITTASTLDAMADSVSNITVGEGGSEGGNSFSVLGYTSTPKYIQDGIDYGQTIYDNWKVHLTKHYDYDNDTKLKYFPQVDTSNVTDMASMFANSINLVYVPFLDTSKVTSMTSMFQNCSGLTSLDLSNWNTSNVKYMSSMFQNCRSLTSLDLSGWDTSKVTSMTSMFKSCTGLTSLDLSGWDTSNATSLSSMFEVCKSLTKVDGYISFKSYSSSTMSYSYLWGYSEQNNLRKITYKDIGYHTNARQFNNKYETNWGVNSDTITDARQSLIDSLITYSFDRATAGYSTCTVTLSTNTKAVLTDDEIAQITAKGFTIA